MPAALTAAGCAGEEGAGLPGLPLDRRSGPGAEGFRASCRAPGFPGLAVAAVLAAPATWVGWAWRPDGAARPDERAGGLPAAGVAACARADAAWAEGGPWREDGLALRCGRDGDRAPGCCPLPPERGPAVPAATCCRAAGIGGGVFSSRDSSVSAFW